MTSVFAASIPIQHAAVIIGGGGTGNHGEPINTYTEPVARQAIAVYPLHRLPHHDIVGSEYIARTMIDFIMEVPDASIFTKQDQITYDGKVFLVAGFPFNWGDNDPFGFGSMFGGSVHIERVS